MMNSPRSAIHDYTRYQRIIAASLSRASVPEAEAIIPLARLAYCLHANRPNHTFNATEAQRFIPANLWRQLTHSGLFSVRACALGQRRFGPAADDNLYAFYRPGYERYFAARFLVDNRSQLERAAAIRPHLHDPAWYEIILYALASLPAPEAGDLVWRLCLDPSRTPSRYEDVLHRDLNFADHAAAAGITLTEQGADRTVEEQVALYFAEGRGMGLHSEQGKALAEWLGAGNDAAARERAANLMIARLSDADEKVRRDAADGLRLIGAQSEAAQQALWDAYQREADSWIKSRILIDLGAASPGSERVIELLLTELLNDERHNNAEQAAEALLELGKLDEQAWRHLFDNIPLIHDMHLRGNIAGKIAREKLANPSIAEALIAWLHQEQDGYVRSAIINALAAFDQKRIVKEVLYYLDHDTDWRVNAAAASWLKRKALRRDTVIRQLRSLREADNWHTLDSSAISLSQVAHRQDVRDELLNLVQNSPSQHVRSAIARALQYIHQPSTEVVNVLLKVMQNDEDRFVRYFAAHSLSKLAPWSDEVVAAIISQLDPNEHRGIVETLGYIRRPNKMVDRALVDNALAQSVGLNREHEPVPHALGMRRMGNPGMVVLLLEAMQKGDENARDIIAEYLRWERPAGDAALVSILIGRLRQAKDKSVRIAAAKALSGGGQGNPAAVDALFAALSKDMDEELYEAILFSITRLVGAREDVAELFYQAIADGKTYRTREGMLSALLNKLAEPAPAARQCGDLLR